MLRHYGIRSYEQGLKKIFRDRLPRYDAQEKRRGWHIHYDFIARDPHRLVVNSSELTEYYRGTPWNLQQTFDSTQGVSGNLGYFLANLVRPNASLRDFLAVAIDLSRRRYIAKWGNRQSKLSRFVRKIIFSSWVRLLIFDWRD